MADLGKGPYCSGMHVVADTGYVLGDTVSRSCARNPPLNWEGNAVLEAGKKLDAVERTRLDAVFLDEAAQRRSFNPCQSRCRADVASCA